MYKRQKLQRERTQLGQSQSKIRKEMELYESFSFAGKGRFVGWWKRHEGVLPLLASVAKRILAIPASSAKSERVFSTGGSIVTPKRNRLSPKNVESLIVIKENLALLEDFVKTSPYVIKHFEDEENPFEVINIEEHLRENEGDENDLDLPDLEDEEMIFLGDDIEMDDDSDDEGPDPNNEGFIDVN